MNHLRSILFLVCFTLFSSSNAQINEYFNQIKTDPIALYAFFKEMPKGGELHYHLAGGPYPETMLTLAMQGSYCLDLTTLSMQKMTGHCDGIPIKNIFNNPDLYNKIIRSWSMKDFVPGSETGHDHFFSGFLKYMPIVFDYRPQLIADVIQRAAEQKEHYLEIMDIPDNAQSVRFGELITEAKSFEEKRQLLLANKDFQNNVKNTVLEADSAIEQAYKELDCVQHPDKEACKVQVKLIYYVLREQTPDNLFAQALNAFEAVSQSKGNLVGVNLVQPEDGLISLRDYHKQMLVFNYLHSIYPNVSIALHAGELSPQGVAPNDLRFHIQDALLTGQAKRIGHGVDIGYENNPEQTMSYMAEHQIPVEINLISNLKILNISGKNHPLNYYLKHNVPVVLSTDDEGVLRTDLTHQYVEAAFHHGLNYQQLKQISRNALTYSFLPGKSIWSNAAKEIITPECQNLNSESCQEWIKQSEKARLQWNLEQKLNAFENKYQR